jgi:hypothetical protein
MDRPLTVWAKLLLRLGLVLLAVGTVPALIVKYVLVDIDALIPALLLFSVAPLGVLALAIAAILFLVAWVRRAPGPS